MSDLKNIVVQKLKDNFENYIQSIVDFNGTLTVCVKKEKLFDVCSFLKNDSELDFDMCKDVVGVDYKRVEFRFEVVYNLYSIKNKSRFLLKTQLEESNPHVPSVVSIWPGANWPEREVYDFYGIVFDGHPDLRRIYMPEDFEYYPLRKEFPLMGIPNSIPLPRK
jgi:NADH-quinone oxidoreductase subunit C